MVEGWSFIKIDGVVILRVSNGPGRALGKSKATPSSWALKLGGLGGLGERAERALGKN